MNLQKKEIKISVVLDYHLLNAILSDISNKTKTYNQQVDFPQVDFPQVDFLKKIKMPNSFAGIFLSKEEYNIHLKSFFSKEEKHEIEFSDFVRGLLNRKGDSKRIFLRSSFLERIDEDSALELKNIFLESGFSFNFQIIMESPVTLLAKDFLSLFYQIPTNFKFSKLESFFQNIFKQKIEKVILGLNLLLKVFGENNISFFYNESIPLEKEFEKNLYKKLGIETFLLGPEKQERFEIDPLFLEYIRCKQLEGKLDIRKEVSEIREIVKKFKLKNLFSYKEISMSSMESLKKLSEKLESFLSEEQKPLKNFMFIKTDTCTLKHIIPFIKKK